MSRVIKFRAWDTSFEKWVTHSVTISAEGRIFLMFVDDNQKFHCFPKTSEEIIIQQFTGLKDKNNQEIYEGDLIKTLTGFTANVEFIEGCFTISLSKDGPAMPLFILNKPIEIIGNIFENPELLIK
jgi:uncharacterized phage protein (TIGR01671 family)